MARALEAVGATLAERLRGGASPATILGERGSESVVPVLEPLVPLFPGGGMRKGTTVAVSGSASLLLALLAGASRNGAWCAVAGMPSLSPVAAAEAGVELSRLAFIPQPGPELAGVVAALVDGVEVVVVGQASRLHAAEVRRLEARARQRGAVLIGFGDLPGADVRLSVAAGEWHGLGRGSGHLRARRARVRLEGRGSAAKGRHVDLWLPAAGGGMSGVDDERVGGRADLRWPHQAAV